MMRLACFNVLRSTALSVACVAVSAAAEPVVAVGFTSQANWVLAPAAHDRVAIALRNPGASAWDGTLRLEVCDASGHPETSSEQAVHLAAQGQASADTAITVGAQPGERLLRWRLFSKPGQQVAGWERSAMVATDDYAFILFEREPIARGLEFRRDHVSPTEIISGGLHRWVWKCGYQSHPLGWWHSVYANLSDPGFRNGAAPVVDVTAYAIQRADAPINLSADAVIAAGGVVAKGWGSRGPKYVADPPWKEVTAQLDDALFNRTAHPAGDPNLHLTDGCDLRFNACSADGELRSLVVRRYARSGDVAWSRLLRPLGVDCGKDRFVFAPGATVPAVLTIANRAAIPFTATAAVTFSDYRDKQLWKRSVPVTIPAGVSGTCPVSVATTDLPRGVYTLAIDVAGLIRTETLITLSDETPIAKAKDGDFLYGTDIGGPWTDARKLDWADFMGFDLIRNCARTQTNDHADLDGAIAELKRRGLRGHLMADPAWNSDAAKRTEADAKTAEYLTWAATAHGDFLKWYELGNEPDLPFFFGGPTDAYVDGYRTLRNAIKQHDAESVVLNGGLCFAGKEAWTRAHEIVAKMPANEIDAWAYHGHGPGATAERNAWERQDKAVTGAGKQQIIYIETESGLFANDPPTRRRQAQTIVEKLVYVQSKGAPVFFWFSLNMAGRDWGYSTIEREREGRPAALAGRTMMQALKGLKWQAALDLQAPEAEAHLFAAADGRRCAVLWSDRGDITRLIAIGPGATALCTDLWGNQTPAASAGPGCVQVAVGADPLFVSWRTTDPTFTVTVPPPALVLPAVLNVVPGQRAVLPIALRNPTAVALAGTLHLTVVGGAPVKPTVQEQAVQLAASGTANATATFDVAAIATSAWPRQWTVFAPLDGEIDPGGFSAIPSTIANSSKDVRPLVGIPDGLDLDLAALCGGVAEKKQALCFATLVADRDSTIEIGASADWWMEWYVNGQRVFSTIDGGNQAPQQILAHVFTVQLKRGSNLLAVRVLSGSGGFRMVAGGPDELAAARRERAGEPDAVRVELRNGTQVLASEPVPVHVLRPVDALDPVPLATATDWTTQVVDGQLGSVTNLFAAQPESARWYQGPADLSARIWLRQSTEGLVVAMAVRDDLDRPGDHAVVRCAAGATLDQRWEQPFTRLKRDDTARLTWYQLTIPRARVGTARFAIQVEVHDDDWGEEKQWAAWGAGTDPERWYQAWLR